MDNNQYWTIIQQEWSLDDFKSAIEDYLNSFSLYYKNNGGEEKDIRLTDEQISRIHYIFEIEFGTDDLSYVDGIEQGNLNDFINGLACEFCYE